jgi:NAD(P)-dependent dehydrogenase (short-subunit alcohol dehydrogenase family)
LELEGRVAIVTGGSSGIGRAISELFAKEKGRVVIADISSGEETAKAAQYGGGSATFIRTDVRDSAQVRRLVEETVATYGTVDIVCNNAGIELVHSIVDTSEADWETVLDTNLKGPFLVCKYALPHMVAKKKGVVINIASQMGLVGSENLGAYCASKAGLILLTKVMALEYARHGIRVNCICPGPIQTPASDRHFGLEPNPDQARRAFLREVPLNRFGKPEEIAQVALFLASARSSFMTGESVVVDGGYVIQ